MIDPHKHEQNFANEGQEELRKLTLRQFRAKNAYSTCEHCGVEHGKNKIDDLKSIPWRIGKCEICGRRKLITDFKNYGHSKY